MNNNLNNIDILDEVEQEYNYKDMPSRKNPYAEILRNQASINIKVDVIDYFKMLDEEEKRTMNN